MQYELGVIGGGNMAQAILNGVFLGKFLEPRQVVVHDPSPLRQQLLAAEFGLVLAPDNKVCAASRHVLLAVKPQVVKTVLEEIAPIIKPDTVVVSIAAGIGTGFIDHALGGRGRIIRVMPNIPMLVGAGASAIAAGPRATAGELQWAEHLFQASGKTVTVKESMIDGVTAISGSGPAYFFYLIEAMIEAAVAEGLPADVAALLATQTCIGAGLLLEHTGQTPQALRQQVTTSNGTTQRAIETLEAGHVKETLVAAIRAAAARSRELGK